MILMASDKESSNSSIKSKSVVHATAARPTRKDAVSVCETPVSVIEEFGSIDSAPETCCRCSTPPDNAGAPAARHKHGQP